MEGKVGNVPVPVTVGLNVGNVGSVFVTVTVGCSVGKVGIVGTFVGTVGGKVGNVGCWEAVGTVGGKVGKVGCWVAVGTVGGRVGKVGTFVGTVGGRVGKVGCWEAVGTFVGTVGGRVGKVGTFVGTVGGRVGKVGCWEAVGTFVGTVGGRVGNVGTFVGTVGGRVGKVGCREAVGTFVGTVGGKVGKVGCWEAVGTFVGTVGGRVGKVGTFVGTVGGRVGKVGKPVCWVGIVGSVGGKVGKVGNVVAVGPVGNVAKVGGNVAKVGGNVGNDGMDPIHEEILSNYNRGRTSLCSTDFELIRNWQFDPNITLELSQYLTSAGWNEMEGIGRRYQAAFPSILTPYTPNDYRFRSSDFQRTQVSLHAFADGVFGVNGHEQINLEEIIGPDYLLRGYSFCPLYNEIITNLAERDAFREGPEYQQMTGEVSAKLGFHGSHALRNLEVATLALTCKYEQIWNMNATSALCSAFSVANRQVIEYYEDLEFYYRVGPGKTEYRRLFENMQDLLGFLQSTDESDHKARVYSGHVTILPMILMNLGAFETDERLTQFNFAQQTQRAWRAGMVMPMGANLAVIRYDCDSGDNDVLFLYNEKPLQIPGCESNGLCKQSFIMERFSRFLEADCREVYCTNS
ncbi:Multiple inositol polyphosphate phosphatase 1 [Pseudolycoriella hygida]|uniref:Multiple inositol polyphosphate phosphatase 1 n=1 Tax=Pseudolycoriella hygida TaxID=35572 RepID=A0A9Q0MMV8_9DIPT|nr:Multiple inositol polyphosphate phosphatase 1 [Pseudolycoriella hygida]